MKQPTMHATIIHTDGSEELFEGTFEEVKAKCGFDWAEVVQLSRCPNPHYRDKCMLVDEEGHVHGRQKYNKRATQIYHSICIPGTTATIVGDVAIVPRKEVV